MILGADGEKMSKSRGNVINPDDVVAELGADPGGTPLAGGTDLMVEINFGRARPAHVCSLRRLDELRGVRRQDGRTACGAGVTYSELLAAPVDRALHEAARTVGSPQIRNAGTLGGNLGTCSPAGDLLPALAALDATIVLASAAGERAVPFAGYMRGPGRPVLRPGELVVRAEWQSAGPSQAFCKVGTRTAMVIAVASLALVVDRARRRVGVALGSVGPVVHPAAEAEQFAAGLFEEHGWERQLRCSEAAARRFGELCAAATDPIDDVRGTAAYRRRVAAVLGRRTLVRVGAEA
jgi:CO/xanthine dehydrogenase FAD-binding subunit